jgi:hypothetical protein
MLNKERVVIIIMNIVLCLGFVFGFIYLERQNFQKQEHAIKAIDCCQQRCFNMLKKVQYNDLDIEMESNCALACVTLLKRDYNRFMKDFVCK